MKTPNAVSSGALAVVILTGCLSGFAQGKLTLTVDAASLVTLDGNLAHVLPEDAVLAGKPVGNTAPLPSGVILTIGLYAGTISNSLILQDAGTMDDPAFDAGYVAGTRIHHIILDGIPGIASGTPLGPNSPWFQVRVWDSTYASYELTPPDRYRGQGPLFQMNPGNMLNYIATAPPSPNSS